MRVIKITFLETYLFDQIFMYKIHLESSYNINETIEIITHDINEALDILLEERSKIIEKEYKWITNFISVMMPTNDINEAMHVFLDCRKQTINSDIDLSNGKCIIKRLETKYSDCSISPINILEDMKLKNSVFNSLIEKLKLEVIQ